MLLSYVMSVLRCILCCITAIVKYFNKHAFIETALSGTNFCQSSAKALVVILSNALRFGVLHGLGSIIMVLSKIFITITVVLVTHLTLVYLLNTEVEVGINYLSPLVVRFLYETLNDLRRSLSWWATASPVSSCTFGRLRPTPSCTATAWTMKFRRGCRTGRSNTPANASKGWWRTPLSIMLRR